MLAPTKAYWQLARAPRHSLLFALPLLLLYEALAFALTRDAFLGVRNGADVMLKSVFVWMGGRNGLAAFGMLLLGVGGWIVVRDLRRAGAPKPRVFSFSQAPVNISTVPNTAAPSAMRTEFQ